MERRAQSQSLIVERRQTLEAQGEANVLGLRQGIHSHRQRSREEMTRPTPAANKRNDEVQGRSGPQSQGLGDLEGPFRALKGSELQSKENGGVERQALSRSLAHLATIRRYQALSC